MAALDAGEAGLWLTRKALTSGAKLIAAPATADVNVVPLWNAK